MTLLGLSFAVLMAHSPHLSSRVLTRPDEGLASGVNNASSRIAQRSRRRHAAAGVASFESGYEVGLAVAAVTSIGGALIAAISPNTVAAKSWSRV